ncbi:MAG: hypothetical protein HZB35_08500 [Nitrospirae bacterium]|nr:hypothetical protein [Nitrospirota bacterium]
MASEEVTNVGKILANFETYHLRRVTLIGTVNEIHLVDQIPNNNIMGWPCRNVYQFRLEDETGSIIVLMGDVCTSRHPGPVVAAGDHVVVHASIQAPGYYIGMGTPIAGETRDTGYAIAADVLITTSAPRKKDGDD